MFTYTKDVTKFIGWKHYLETYKGDREIHVRIDQIAAIESTVAMDGWSQITLLSGDMIRVPATPPEIFAAMNKDS